MCCCPLTNLHAQHNRQQAAGSRAAAGRGEWASLRGRNIIMAMEGLWPRKSNSLDRPAFPSDLFDGLAR